jgi:hypothetical protein
MVNARLSFQAREMIADPVALVDPAMTVSTIFFWKGEALALADGGRLPIIPSCATEGVTTQAKRLSSKASRDFEQGHAPEPL